MLKMPHIEGPHVLSRSLKSLVVVDVHVHAYFPACPQNFQAENNPKELVSHGSSCGRSVLLVKPKTLQIYFVFRSGCSPDGTETIAGRTTNDDAGCWVGDLNIYCHTPYWETAEADKFAPHSTSFVRKFRVPSSVQRRHKMARSPHRVSRGLFQLGSSKVQICHISSLEVRPRCPQSI